MWRHRGRNFMMLLMDQFIFGLNRLLDLLDMFIYRLKNRINFYGIRDTQIRLLGILILVLAICFIVFLASNLSQIFREFIPWIAGSRAGEIYWRSWEFGFKASGLIFLLLVAVLLYVLANRK